MWQSCHVNWSCMLSATWFSVLDAWVVVIPRFGQSGAKRITTLLQVWVKWRQEPNPSRGEMGPYQTPSAALGYGAVGSGEPCCTHRKLSRPSTQPNAGEGTAGGTWDSLGHPKACTLWAKLSTRRAGCWGGAALPKCSPVRPVPDTLELVEDAVILVERAELAPQVVVNLQAGRDGA